MASESDFKAYVEWRLNEKGLFERGFIQSLKGMFTQLSLDPCSEPAYLASFAALAGGWNTDVGRKLVEDIGVRRIEDIEEADLTTLPEHAEYHAHRHMNYRDVDRAVESLSALSYDGTDVSSFSEFVNSVFTQKQLSGSTEAFDIGMNELKRLDSFGRIAAFDYLEVLTRAHGHDWMAPDQLRLSHIKTSKPRETFEEIYNTSVDDPAAQRNLDELQRWAQLEQDMNRVEAVFDIESCLCTFESDLEKGNWSRSDCL